ncbi:carbohydrate binding domain-containing protein [Candidatus Leptofilum sp.]|uniref:carbohydrate binding domain-containing protein n=1 Tax=Candidatus Leptofilum sp. TaxID=3241576 RepID=UPI003B59725F
MSKKTRAFTFLALAGLLLTAFLAPFSLAAATPDVVIDDFEDGDTSDWIFFGGNAAGGGGGPLDDRPQEGSFYFSTGWGGEGTASDFYGGTFKNFDNAAQVTLPADPVFNIWVLNQSNATVDEYRLEITIREDLDGDGWTSGSEDSFRYDTTFAAASFDDEWTLISAPVSSFADQFTGGDGTFNGNLDEIVIVVAGVQGAVGSTVEVDFDNISFSSGTPTAIIDDFEDGDTSDWIFFGGNAAGGGGGPLDDRPQEGSFYFSTGWGGEGTASDFYGGTFKNFDNAAQVILPADPVFNIWVLNQSNATVDEYRLEITIREDLDGDGWTSGSEDSFRYDTTFTSASFDDEWTLVSAPVSSFADQFTGGDGTFNGALDEIVIVVAGVQGAVGSTVEVDFDNIGFTGGSQAPSQIIDDFENGLPAGVDENGIPVGFLTFSDGSPVSIATTDAPPEPVPDSAAGNNVMALTGDVTAFAGFVHAFENTAVDTWVPQDWSGYEGFSFWLYGLNNGTTVFVDVIDNRNPGSTTDDGERFTVSLIDDFSGWQFFEFPFSSFVRKDIGNGAPNDGFTLTQIHGWALGTLNTPGEVTYYIDDVAVYGVAEIPDLAVTFANANYDIEEGSTGEITVQLNRPMNSDDPAQVSVDYFTEPASATPRTEYTPTSGTLTFVNGGASELSFSLETFDDTKWEGTERVILRLTNPVDVEAGFAVQAAASIVENDTYDPNLLDDFERFPHLWNSSDSVTLSNPTFSQASPLARPGQDAYEGVLQIEAPLAVEIEVQGTICNRGNGIIPVVLFSTDSFDATTVDHTTVTLGDAYEFHKNRRTRLPIRHEEDVDGDGDLDLVFHFHFRETGLPCFPEVVPFNGQTYDGQAITAGGATASFGRDFAIGQDWSNGEALTFWYYGSNSGEEVTVNLKDNRAPDPGPAGWEMVWSEEFNEPAGTPPNPDYWSYEIGDGTVNGIPGWGNDEFQYYTDDPANAATDGNGNMVLTVHEADGSLQCYYGPCDYTSARLISWRKAEFAYGRIESRILVPEGEAGLWPAFWSLGTDIDVVGWPQTGEIDFMEYVSRLPNEIFGTIHGPGYAGGQSFGNVVDFGEPVYNNYHTFTIEWQPDLIEWYVDGMLYHTATPDDVAPNEWVFNDPVFLLLNVAIGGNFGGTIDPELQLPQSMAVDYIRVYQGPDTAEQFEATFVDNFTGWQQIEVPFTAFTRSDEQPAGAPNDGLTLSEVWGYGITLPDSGLPTGTTWLDMVAVKPVPPPTALTVTTLADSGEGSLREAVELIAPDGTITFDPSLAGGTIALSSGQLDVVRSMTIDGSGAPGLTVSGSNASRVFQVAAGAEVSINSLTVADGVGSPQGGGILNYGVLNLDNVTVMNNTESSGGAPDFQFGGGGIYNGDGATLNMTNSAVMNNSTLGQPGGGIYGFFNSSINLTNSTVSGNVAGDVAGGLRTLGNATIVNSTISGNTSTAWHGGAMFSTDGTVTILNSTIVGNSAPDGTAGGLMVATFGAAVNVTVQNSLIADNGTYNCQVEGDPATAVLTSLGNNVVTGASCAAVGSDIIVAPGGAGVDVLADNGGSTLTHALLAGSVAIDAANTAVCPTADQRGITRDAACDIGAFEYVP